MNFSFSNKHKTFRINVNEVGFFRRGVGLMFRKRNTENLLFKFSRPSKIAITSFYVFFTFLAVWLDENKRILECQVVKPFRLSISPKNNSKYLLELPFNKKNLKLIETLLKDKKYQ